MFHFSSANCFTLAANTFAEGKAVPYDAGDGLYYDDDARFLNLRGTKMVTLSACETGTRFFSLFLILQSLTTSTSTASFFGNFVCQSL